MLARLQASVRLRRTCCLLFLAASAHAQLHLTGRVTNETDAPIPGAAITVTAGPTSVEATSDATGAFALTLATPAIYSLNVDRDGFYVHTAPLDLSGGEIPGELHVVLQTVHELHTALDVNGKVGMIDMDRTTPQTTLSGRTLYDIPFPDQNSLRSGLRMIPGVTQDSSGDVHLYGGSETQAEYSFEGFQLNDPLTGRLDARMSLESVQSVDVAASQSGADVGRGAAGVMALHARTGSDAFQYSATNIFPGLSTGKGFNVGSWTPRGNISGPWIRGRAWYFNTLETQYSNTFVPTLPSGQVSARAWRVSDLLHNQINFTPHDLFFIGLLVNYRVAPRNGLTTLDPISTTQNLRSGQFFGYMKGQHLFSHSALIELGFATSRTYSRAAPQGLAPYTVTPDGRAGNNYLNAGRGALREQGIANIYLPSFNLFGEHRFRLGADLIHLAYNQNISRADIDYTDPSGALARLTTFSGSGRVRLANDQTSIYLQDSWRVRPRLTIDAGVRGDHDRLLGHTNLSPRVGFGWSPFGAEDVRISRGFARIFDPADLRLFVRPLDQTSTSTFYRPLGGILYGPVSSVFRMGPGVVNPVADIWNVAAERTFPKQMHARLQLLRRRYSRGFDYVDTLPGSEQLPSVLSGAANPGPVIDAFVLNSDRQDKYDSAEISIHQPIGGRFEWMASYTRSRAWSNAILDRGIDQPLSGINNFGPLPWDAPNRFVSWGFLPTFRKNWSLAYLLDWHTGFPFSVQDQYGQLVGQPDSRRFNQFFELDLFLERQLVFRGYILGVRGGFNNITGHQNSNVVDNVVGGPSYLHQYGGQTRAVNFRVRFLGRQ